MKFEDWYYHFMLLQNHTLVPGSLGLGIILKAIIYFLKKYRGNY
jgi:hypothetical protein